MSRDLRDPQKLGERLHALRLTHGPSWSILELADTKLGDVEHYKDPPKGAGVKTGEERRELLDRFGGQHTHD